MVAPSSIPPMPQARPVLSKPLAPGRGLDLQKLAEINERFAAQNDKLEAFLGLKKGEVHPAPLKDHELSGYRIGCAACGTKGPEGKTMYSAAMKAQMAGYAHDSSTVKVGGEPVKWYCSAHKPKTNR